MEQSRKKEIIYQPVLQSSNEDANKSTNFYTEKAEEPLNESNRGGYGNGNGCCADCIEALLCCNLLASCFNNWCLCCRYCEDCCDRR